MKVWKKIAAACGLSLALAAGTCALLAGCGGGDSEAAARMQVDINPSVEFILCIRAAASLSSPPQPARGSRAEAV